MSGQIILVRHAETAANAARLWQGTSNGGFSVRGRTQLDRLARRLRGTAPVMVVSSDLGRAEATAGGLGYDFDVDARWREPDLGTWDGLTYEEIMARHPEELRSVLDGDDIPMGGADRLSEVVARTRHAFEDVAAKVAGGGTAIVVGHGIALLALVGDLLGVERLGALQVMHNAAFTTFTVGDYGPQLVSYNDTAHLDETVALRPGETEVVLIRHGQTTANLEQRWQGHGDWPLTAAGLTQAERLAFELPRLAAIYASPLLRARDTAVAIGDLQGREVRLDPGLKEIGFGAWENMTTIEIEASDPDGWTVFMGGQDVVRGGTGETFESVKLRMVASIERIVSDHPGSTVGVVSHGGATRAFLSGVLGLGYGDRYRIHSMGNTAFARFVFGSRGAVLVAWNVAPHLPDPA